MRVTLLEHPEIEANPVNSPFPLSLRALEWLLLIGLGIYFCFQVLPRAWLKLDTDFPNYYVAARLARDGYDTSRVYEWTWIQRQKNRLGIDQPVVGFVPLTPFSALVVWPLTHLSPLEAKHIWNLVNVILLASTVELLYRITAVPWHRIAVLALLSIPLQRNLQYGQYYVLLLAILTLALWSYLRGWRATTGLLLAIAFGLKIFPVLFALYLARKRDLRGLAGLGLGIAGVVLVSLAVFGLAINHVYLLQILPAALRGEAMDPYNLGASSISSLLHALFIQDPDWNSKPALQAPMLVAVLQPLLQMLVLAPAILLAAPSDRSMNRIKLEWSAMLLALLTISTMPASYHFVLLLLPVTVLTGLLAEQKRYSLLIVNVLLYLAIGYPNWRSGQTHGWLALLDVPRLYFMLLLCAISYFLLREVASRKAVTLRWAWAAVLAVLTAIQVAGLLRHQRDLYANHSTRVEAMPSVFLSTSPVLSGDGVSFIAMQGDGYHMGTLSGAAVHIQQRGPDRLALAAAAGQIWVEQSGLSSEIVRTPQPSDMHTSPAVNGESPALSPDGRRLASLRTCQGRGQIWLRSLTSAADDSHSITPADLNVLELSYMPDGWIAFSAVRGGETELFFTDDIARIVSTGIRDARYPAGSPDGKWLAYSRLEKGTWNIWIQNLATRTERRITRADCNDLSPSWLADSKTLIYASDCGRGLWLTALHRVQVNP